jgi:hypothetical protein
MRFTGGVFRDDGKNHLARRKVSQAFFAGDELALGWKDGRNPNQILSSDSGIAKSQLERR